MQNKSSNRSVTLTYCGPRKFRRSRRTSSRSFRASLLPVLGAGLDAGKRQRMAPSLMYATPDAALGFWTISAVNRIVADFNATPTSRRSARDCAGSKRRGRFSVQFQSNSRGWLHRVFPRKRHQMRHLCDFALLSCKAGALPAELHAHCDSIILIDRTGKWLKMTAACKHMLLVNFFEYEEPSEDEYAQIRSRLFLR